MNKKLQKKSLADKCALFEIHGQGSKDDYIKTYKQLSDLCKTDKKAEKLVDYSAGRKWPRGTKFDVLILGQAARARGISLHKARSIREENHSIVAVHPSGDRVILPSTLY